MDGTWQRMPAPVRALAAASSEAVEAARVRDADRFAVAVARLAAMDPEQVGHSLGVVVRLVLEDLHPDGLAGDDVRRVLDHCVRAAAVWQPAIDPHLVLILLAGALGVHDPDGEPPPAGADEYARHACLLLADLLADGRSFEGYLRNALREIERGERLD